MTTEVTLSPVSRPVAIAAMLGSAACWGGGTVMTKGALDSFGPFLLLSIQLIASVTVLGLAALALRVERPPLRTIAKTGVTGLLEPGLAYSVGVPGLVLTTASNATVIASLEPVFVFLLAWAIFGTAIRHLSVVAVAIAVCGGMLVSLASPDARLDAVFDGVETLFGDGLILLGTVFAALYVIASSHLAKTMPAVLLTVLQQSFGLAMVLVLLVIVLLAGWEAVPQQITFPMLSLAVVSGLIQYALAFWLYIVGLKGIPAGLAGLFLTTTPIFGILGGILFLGEAVTSLQLLGVALVILGLCWVLTLERDD